MMITKASESDLPAILELQYLAYQSEAKLFNNMDIPPLKQTLPEMRQEYEKGVILKALNEKNDIIGSIRFFHADHTVYIGKLIVHPNWQRKGIGTKLLLEVERVCPNKRYELFTSTRSKRNIRLYENLGYKSFQEKAVHSDLRFIFLEKHSK